MDRRELAQKIDHTLLKADATDQEIDKLCFEALKHSFWSVCVNGAWVSRAAENLKASSVKVCAVVGFPLGATTTETKVQETKNLIRLGAEEIDMVMAIGAIKSMNFEFVHADIQAVVRAAEGHVVKVILETSLLNQDQKIRACELSLAAGAGFVKTSTGFAAAGATIEDVRLLKEICEGAAEVKASGGIRTRDQALQMIEAGAARLGTSQSVSILSDATSETQGAY